MVGATYCPVLSAPPPTSSHQARGWPGSEAGRPRQGKTRPSRRCCCVLCGATASEPPRHGFLGNQDRLPLRLTGNFLLTALRSNVYVSQRKEIF